jgi:hypothetical protein
MVEGNSLFSLCARAAVDCVIFSFWILGVCRCKNLSNTTNTTYYVAWMTMEYDCMVVQVDSRHQYHAWGEHHHRTLEKAPRAGLGENKKIKTSIVIILCEMLWQQEEWEEENRSVFSRGRQAATSESVVSCHISAAESSLICSYPLACVIARIIEIQFPIQ